jgi:hypothetical protein
VFRRAGAEDVDAVAALHADSWRRFYRACGATCVEAAAVAPPGGDPTRLNGTPLMLRMVAWPDVTDQAIR